MLAFPSDPLETCRLLAERVRQLRLERGWTQVELARRASVAFSTLKHFEHTGRISLERLVLLATALQALDGFERLFELPRAASLSDIERRGNRRQRGRRRGA